MLPHDPTTNERVRHVIRLSASVNVCQRLALGRLAWICGEWNLLELAAQGHSTPIDSSRCIYSVCVLTSEMLSKSLQQRLNYAEMDSHSHDDWTTKTVVDYSEIRLWYMLKIVCMCFFMLVDIGFNSSVDHDEPRISRQRNTITMILFGAQIVGQILSFVIFFLLLCGTYLFRVGLISLLSKHFKEVLVVTVVYIVWTAVLGLERMSHVQDGAPLLSLWSRFFYFPLTVGHKLVACVYYVMSIRTVLRLGDPKFYTKVSHSLASILFFA